VLADELVGPLLRDGAVAVAVAVGSVGLAGYLSVDANAAPQRPSRYRRSHDEVKVAGVESAGDLPVCGVQRGGLCLDGPVPRQGPLVEPQPHRDGVKVGRAWPGAAGGCEVLGALIAGVVLR
jgi:hypothetical protein